jgi:hypothetical protein
MRSTKLLWPAAALLLAAAPLPAGAAITTYVGSDLAVSATDPHPNATAAAAAFDAAVPGAGLITFEGTSSNPIPNLMGVTLSGVDQFGNDQFIHTAPVDPEASTEFGFNTTPGGKSYLANDAGTDTFTFSTPIDAFGAYFTGVQVPVRDSIVFSDGTTETILLPNAGSDPGSSKLPTTVTSFVGFTDPGKQISSVTILAGLNSGGSDWIGIDDVRFGNLPPDDTGPGSGGTGSAPGIPEPASWALMIMGFGGAGAMLRRRSKHAPA